MSRVAYLQYVGELAAESEIRAALQSLRLKDGSSFGSHVEKLVLFEYPHSTTRYCRLVFNSADAANEFLHLTYVTVAHVACRVCLQEPAKDLAHSAEYDRRCSVIVTSTPELLNEYGVRTYIRKELHLDPPTRALQDEDSAGTRFFVMRLINHTCAAAAVRKNAELRARDPNHPYQITHAPYGLPSAGKSEPNTAEDGAVPLKNVPIAVQRISRIERQNRYANIRRILQTTFDKLSVSQQRG